MRLTVGEIASAVGAACLGPAAGGVEVSGFTWDSREVAPGDIYVALPGQRADGHDFAEAAIDAGAVAVMATRDIGMAVPVVMVQDTSRAIADLARFWRGRLTGTVIGLTGSSGKTTTKNLVRDVLSHDLNVTATQANRNNELGVPATLLSADADADAVIVEMGMRGPGQIAELCAVAMPDWGLITNIGTSHIELLGSRDGIARAKAELFESLPEGRGLAFVNAEDDYAQAICDIARLEERGITPVYYGVERALQPQFASAPYVWASDVSFDGEGRPSFTMNAIGFEQLGLDEANASRPCTMQLRGMHNVSNACAAAAVGMAGGMTLASCCDALEAASPEKGRQVVFHTESGLTVVDDAYNANPDSMAASLATFATMGVSGRRIAVLGDMMELGDFARESHERIGMLAAASGLDRLVCVGGLARHMALSAVVAGMDAAAVSTCDNVDEALDQVMSLVAPGDAVLVKASHSVGLERVVERLVR